VSVSQCASNRTNVADGFVFDESVDPAFLDLLHDPQTSGGLLIALPKEEAPSLVNELRGGSYPDAALIGEVVASDRPLLRLDG